MPSRFSVGVADGTLISGPARSSNLRNIEVDGEIRPTVFDGPATSLRENRWRQRRRLAPSIAKGTAFAKMSRWVKTRRSGFFVPRLPENRTFLRQHDTTRGVAASFCSFG